MDDDIYNRLMAKQVTQAEVHELFVAGEFEAIEQLRVAGCLDSMLGIPNDDLILIDRGQSGLLSAEDVTRLRALRRDDLIERARAEGRIESLAS